jgi:UDP-N-acetylglucosamine 4,6-dehydratase
MQDEFKDERLRFLIGDVRDLPRLKRAMDGVDIALHTAALKHVPVCEYNPMEAVNTNIIGSMNVINAALDCHVGRVLNVSSDKAVNPINIYGATKLTSEKLFSEANVYGGKFSSVRFGNLIGSKGSIVEKLKGLGANDTIQVTDPSMTRLWIEIEEAAEFCIEVLDMMEGGEVFIPKAMPIISVGEVINNLAPHARWEIVGRRGGEKMHEALFNEDDLRNIEERVNCHIIKSH